MKVKREKIGRAQILNIDCMDFLKGCEDNQFDLQTMWTSKKPYGKI